MKLAILDDYQQVALKSADWKRLKGVEIKVFHDAFTSVDDAAQKLAPFDMLCLLRERTAFPRALIERLPNLKFVALTGMRAGSLDSKALAERGIPVSNTRSGNSTYLTSELAWGLIINAARDMAKGERNMRAGRWHEGLAPGIGLQGKRLGVIGLGKIGARVAAAGKVFGMDVVAWSQNLTAEKAAEAGASYLSKEDLLGTSDIVSLHLVLSDRTRGIIGAKELATMKPTAILVNVSRGPLVDEKAMLGALKSGRIAHAPLDACGRGPPPADHPLRKRENVTLSPPLGYVNDENLRGFYGDALENIEAFLDVLERIAVEAAQVLVVDVAEVRREGHVLHLAQRMVGGERLAVVDIERCVSDTAALQRPQHRLLVDQGATRDVHEDRRRLHRRQLFRSDDAGGAIREHEMKADDVGGAEQILLRKVARAGLGRLLGGEVLAPGDHVHAENLAGRGDARADLSQADHAEALALQADAGRQAFVPAARAHVALAFRHVARRVDDEAPGELGSEVGAVPGARVAHRHHTLT